MADEERNEVDGQGPTAQADEEDPAAKAEAAQEEHDEAKEKMEQLEEEPPEKLEDWPDDKAKYETFGGPEGPHSYHEGPEEKLGPSGVRHHEDGSVSVDGEKVDNPDDYKGEPIPGGPTDPNSPDMAGEREKEKDGSADTEGSGEREQEAETADQ
jgi:hypothetical protein